MPPARLGAQAIVDRASARGETLRPDSAVIIVLFALIGLSLFMIHEFDEIILIRIYLQRAKTFPNRTTPGGTTVRRTPSQKTACTQSILKPRVRKASCLIPYFAGRESGLRTL